MMTTTTMSNLRNDIIELLSNYEYDFGKSYEPTAYGVNCLLDEWRDQKAEFISAMESDPNYNGNYQVVLNNDYYRNVDKNTVNQFINWVKDQMISQVVGQEYTAWDGETRIVTDWQYPNEMIFEGKPYGMNQCLALDEQFDQYLSEDATKELNKAFPFLRAHNGAKTSRTIRRICKEYGIDKHPEFNGRYTRYADAINPLKVKRWTIISVNPIDYLKMSWGNSWTSCHDFDKTNKRKVYSGQYHGCYSGGTLSYMLDTTSIVVYVVDESYKGNNYETQPKILRQMFHIGNDKIIQGRLYPQDNDCGASENYKNLREIVQRVVSNWFGWDNLWTNEKGTDACERVINSEGNHYRDYECYDNCNVSYRAGGREKNMIPITVGHIGICPTCGCKVDEEAYIICEDCRDVHCCERCGERIDGDGIETVDGTFFCDWYCAEEYGYVFCTNTDEWRRSSDSDVMYDDYLEEWQYDCHGYWEHAVYTEDGRHFCNEENAMYAGYCQTDDGDWYSEDEVYFCEVCERYVHYSEWNDEEECCNDCAEQRREEVTA